MTQWLALQAELRVIEDSLEARTIRQLQAKIDQLEARRAA